MQLRHFTVWGTAIGRPEGARLDAAPDGAVPVTDSFRGPHRDQLSMSPPFASRRLFSPITQRIIIINLVGLIVLVAGVLVLNRYRAGLIDAELSALRTQGEIVAGALVETALMEPETATSAPRFDIEAAASILRRVGVMAGKRVRMYDYRGRLLLDSRDLLPRQVETYRLPPPGGISTNWPALEKFYDWVTGLLPSVDLPRYVETPDRRGTHYREVVAALTGEVGQEVRVTARGDIIVSVGIPVQRLKVVQGALLITTDENAIAGILRAERVQILQIFLIALGVSALLSIVLSRAIARPIRKLAQAAELVRTRGRGRPEIPTFDDRNDEIGELARAFSDMTSALYARMDAIERFAADVAHEIKNPLTSLRSAVETLERAEDPERRAKLLAIISDDVVRLDRLITDIAGASRLDAELTREPMQKVDLAALLRMLADVANGHESGDGARVQLSSDSGARGDEVFGVLGLESRLAQVFRNILDNALSFSAPDKRVTIDMRLRDGVVQVVIEDEGPGIPPDALERIFERFYTSREEPESFGKHSGLGLSIARQIVTAHGGGIWAENRRDREGQVKGARFIVRLPVYRADANLPIRPEARLP